MYTNYNAKNCPLTTQALGTGILDQTPLTKELVRSGALQGFLLEQFEESLERKQLTKATWINTPGVICCVATIYALVTTTALSTMDSYGIIPGLPAGICAGGLALYGVVVSVLAPGEYIFDSCVVEQERDHYGNYRETSISQFKRSVICSPAGIGAIASLIGSSIPEKILLGAVAGMVWGGLCTWMVPKPFPSKAKAILMTGIIGSMGAVQTVATAALAPSAMNAVSKAWSAISSLMP